MSSSFDKSIPELIGDKLAEHRENPGQYPLFLSEKEVKMLTIFLENLAKLDSLSMLDLSADEKTSAEGVYSKLSTMLENIKDKPDGYVKQKDYLRRK